MRDAAKPEEREVGRDVQGAARRVGHQRIIGFARSRDDTMTNSPQQSHIHAVGAQTTADCAVGFVQGSSHDLQSIERVPIV